MINSENIRYQTILKILLGVVGFFIFIGIILFVTVLSWKIECIDPEKSITIPYGATATAVSEIISDTGCLENTNIFTLGVYLTFNDRRLIPGKYPIKGIRTVGELINLLTTPSGDRVKITLLEGWSIEQIADKIDDEMDIDVFKFHELCRDRNFIHSLNIDAPSLEGFLFPDTYIFLTSYLEEDIIRIMVNQSEYNYYKYLKKYAKISGLSRVEVTSLASIIQGEAMYKDEMRIISSVYHNRLKKDMLLQADPTVQFAIPGKNRRLFYKDLEIDSPYNTYKYKGLPPGPINNPGLDALKAAVRPAYTDYLYFVANGTGRHTFTKTLSEHNKARAKIKRNRRR